MAEQGALFLLSRPPHAAIEDRVRRFSVSAHARSTLFPSHNRHQSWSQAHAPHLRERLQALCASIESPAFEMPLIRAVSRKRADRRFLWQLAGNASGSSGFARLLTELRIKSAALGIDDPHRHTPHVTLAYFAPEPLDIIAFEPIVWLIDHIELVAVAGTGDHYRYETLFRKELDPHTLPASPQATLF